MAYDAKDPDHKTEPIEQLRPPEGAPNVLIVLIDDAGFGSSTAFGGPCKTPNAERYCLENQVQTRWFGSKGWLFLITPKAMCRSLRMDAQITCIGVLPF